MAINQLSLYPWEIRSALAKPLRYLAIVHPLVSRVQQSKARAKRILLGVWAGPCLLAAPFLHPAKAESDTLWSQYGSISRRSCLITLEPGFRRWGRH
ncbi:unnamed protein product [Ixodes persulcatus]